MKAVIMAGGKGTRLRPLTCHLPKPMVPLTGKPCMQYTVELLKQYGIHDIAVTMQYLPEVIRSYFGDGSEFGVNMRYFDEDSPLGTAGSVKNAQKFLDETFIVISGDALTDFNLERALSFHQKQNSLATLVLTRVTHPLEYGIVMTDEQGKVNRFLEKPSWSEVFSDTVNTGIYILEPEVLDRIPDAQEYDFSGQLFPALLEAQEPMYGYISEGYWSDIGNLQQYRQTQFDMLEGKVNVQLNAKQIMPGVYVEEHARISPNVQIKGPAYIGSNSFLEDEVELGAYCVIGRNNRISKGTSLSHSILWDHNHVAERSELSGSTLTSGIVCKEDSSLGDGSVIGSHVTIGAGSTIKPHVKIWPGKKLRERTQLNTSFIWGDHASKSLYKTYGVSGSPNIELTPEVTARFATAYGATVAAGKTLTVSCSPHEFSRLLKRIVTASLQSVGTHVIDLGDCFPPAASFAIRQLGTAGGIHITYTEEGKAACCLECMDGMGLPISKAWERKVENSFWQEDYGRAASGQIGSYQAESGWIETYTRSLAQEISYERTNRQPLRVVVESSPWMQQFAIPYFEQLGVEAIHVTKTNIQEPFAKFVQLSEASLGIRLHDDGRGMQLVTEQGDAVSRDVQIVFLYLSYLHSRPGSTIGAPVSAPHLLESLAEGLGARIVRTKELARAVLEATKESNMHPLFDSFFALGLVLLHLERTGTSFSELLSLLPSFYLHRERIDCPWDHKGQVMRTMMERTKKERADLVDGIKFYHGDQWVLLLPLADDPAFQVIAQSTDPMTAQTLVQAYKTEILNIIQ
ncbi:sugar phosphate nucleotidyltransferase [Paenibacillus hexagrammi]|uniref:NTP transferase domain-containing protein n=1 Tax=Paenibacillus hexagrammi TaxID=2908839 RepID=A0ABY3SN46_9BACL|nr:sugar phosphate nucleotidyltransferase [Paenibacillus sp. YPD9-1]UJF34392.1 NTP transferase domain-containing protein [Paenibacillus sp. YPD9-1]